MWKVAYSNNDKQWTNYDQNRLLQLNWAKNIQTLDYAYPVDKAYCKLLHKIFNENFNQT